MFIGLLGGFLGSGKTTLLIELAKAASESGMKTAIIVNEAGEIGIDGARIESEGLEAIELSEGCICCSLSGSLQNTLITVNREFAPDLILLEPTGLALPHRVEQIIRTSMIGPERILTIGVVDVFRYEDLLKKRRDFMERQLMNADFVVLNKKDLVDENAFHRAVNDISLICPGKEILPLSVKTGEGMDEIMRRIF